MTSRLKVVGTEQIKVSHDLRSVSASKLSEAQIMAVVVASRHARIMIAPASNWTGMDEIDRLDSKFVRQRKNVLDGRERCAE